MRLRITGAALMVAVVFGGCGSAPSQIDATPPEVRTPLDAVDTARDVAADVSQRQADLEAQLRDPFARP